MVVFIESRQVILRLPPGTAFTVGFICNLTKQLISLTGIMLVRRNLALDQLCVEFADPVASARAIVIACSLYLAACSHSCRSTETVAIAVIVSTRSSLSSDRCASVKDCL